MYHQTTPITVDNLQQSDADLGYYSYLIDMSVISEIRLIISIFLPNFTSLSFTKLQVKSV